MERRSFLKTMGLGLSLTAMPGVRLFAAETEYQGQLFVNVLANGGWDITNFCDPKINQPGEAIINNWSTDHDVQQAGNIPYAPFADHQSFFDKHHQKMMVINGIKFNSINHLPAREYVATGTRRSSPSIAALFAAKNGANHSMPWLVDSMSTTWERGVIGRTAMSGSGVHSLITPEKQAVDSELVSIFAREAELVRSHVAQRNQALAGQTDMLPRTQQWLKQFGLSTVQDPRMAKLAENISKAPPAPSSLAETLASRIVFIASALSAGVSVAADFAIGSFDTHKNSDRRQAAVFTSTTNAVDYLWQLAELFGIDQRLTVRLSSEMARTPYYNAYAGKDHWVIGSMIFMEKNAPWRNSVVGKTDEGLNAYKLDPVTLQPNANGEQITIANLTVAIREYFGVNTEAVQKQFPLGENNIRIFG